MRAGGGEGCMCNRLVEAKGFDDTVRVSLREGDVFRMRGV